MLHYLSLFILAILLIVLQSTVTDLIFSSYFMFEMSLVVVIYAGFRLEMMKGLVLTFFLGLILDCVSGSVPGLLSFIYLIVFLCCFFISDFLDTEKNHVIALFSFICVFLKEIMLQAFYYLAFDVGLRPYVFAVIFTQSLVVGLIAPIFFYVMDRAGIFLYEKKV
ncbi:MAG TPA: hypothetical protein PKJ10_07340 [Smithella sp.]|nr:hypothetical protein [Smithella sp.]